MARHAEELRIANDVSTTQRLSHQGVALTHHPRTLVRDPVALEILTTAFRRASSAEPSATSRTTSVPPRSGPLAGAHTLAIVIVTVVVLVAVATPSTSEERCSPIRYVLDDRHGPPGAAHVVHDVFHEIAMMSGVRFMPVQVGDHRQVNTPVRIAWAEHTADLGWKSRHLGYANVIWSHRDATIVSGEVVLRDPIEAEHIHGAPIDWHTVVRHEVGHLMGLPHQANPNGVMYPRLTNRPQTWTSTDRAYLRARGRAAGCDLNAPKSTLVQAAHRS